MLQTMEWNNQKKRIKEDRTECIYHDCSSLNDKARHIKVELPMRGERDTSGYHEYNDAQLLGGVLKAECPGDKED